MPATHRPQKRRKVLNVIEPVQPSCTAHATATTTTRPLLVNTTSPVCTSCHRALNTTYNALIICARCSSPTCAICSRTCNASATSFPPTPRLTRSPTPANTLLQSPGTPTSGVAASPHSPHRAALSLHSPNTNLGDHMQRVAGVWSFTPLGSVGKRKKTLDGADDADGHDLAWGGQASDVFKGCGRTVCRNCCIENDQSGLTTCYDCYSR